MKQNDFQGYVPTKTLLCMMGVVFFVGIFLVGAGVKMAWHQRVQQTAARQAQVNHPGYRSQTMAVGRRKPQWRTGHFRRRHRRNRYQSSKNKNQTNANIPMQKFETR